VATRHSNQDETHYVLNYICDLTQFVISTIVTDPTSSSLAKVFMEHVVLSYVMVAVVIVNVDSKIHGTFSTMCGLLNITLWPLARHNKGLSVECYHRSLNKTQIIRGNDRDTHECFFINIKYHSMHGIVHLSIILIFIVAYIRVTSLNEIRINN